MQASSSIQPIYIVGANILNFSQPLPRYTRNNQEQEHTRTPTNPKRRRLTAPYRLQWAENPYDPSRTLGPPRWAVRNQLFTVEFQIIFHEEFSMVAYFYAKVLPRLEEEYPITCERLQAMDLNRVPLFIPRAGDYCLEIVIVPDDPRYRPARYRHKREIKVVENYNNVAQLGPYERRILDIGYQGNAEDLVELRNPRAGAGLEVDTEVDH